ncbi:uncharacterized protein LOC143299652 [Babylonia areolata]|uniref:uncharacterized protein LOC143299652 n=1 Tax=Babylonia areolata TaxID=304850 RepID=UPI003FD1755F
MTTATLPVRLTPVRRDPGDPDPDPGADPHVASAQYRKYAMEHYDDLLEELEFRSQRAAMMHYHEANRYSRRCYYLEVMAALLGAASVSGIGAFLVKWCGSSGTCPSASRAGALGALGVVLASLLEFGSKGSSSLLPSLCKRCEGHKKAAVGWQRLTRLTRSYRIQLRNPALTPDDFMVWYAHLVQQRQKVSAIALVPSATYRAFNDPGRVFSALKRRREMFVLYQQMYEGKVDPLDLYDDD